MSREAVQGILREVAASVARLPDRAVRDILPILREAQAELRRDLKKWETEHIRGDKSLRFTRQRYRSLLLRLKSTETAAGVRVGVRPMWVDKMQSGLERTLRSQYDDASRLSAFNMQREITELAMAANQFPAPINLARVEEMVSGRSMLVQRHASSARLYAGEAWRDIRRQFAIGVTRQESFDELTKRLQRLGGPTSLDAPDGIFKRHRYRAERLVRTEMMHSYGTHHLESIKAVAQIEPEMQKKWDARYDNRLCVICRELDGQTVAPDEKFRAGGVSYDRNPAHPNCFVPDTRVQGQFVGGLKAWYSGKMVEITTASGKRLTVTPNHPILTDKGWLPASGLMQGIHVFSYNAWNDGTHSPVTLDEQDAPSTICEVFGTLREQLSPRLSATTAGDLHGDARHVDGDVEIVTVDWPFQEVICPHLVGDLSHPLPDMKLPSETRFRSGDFGPVAPLGATHSVMGSHNLLDTLRIGHSGPLDFFSVGPAAYLNTLFQKSTSENSPVDANIVAELLEGSSGQVVSDELVKVRNFDFSGHVYDLQSTNGWLFASNIVASNCRCAVVAWLPGVSM